MERPFDYAPSPSYDHKATVAIAEQDFSTVWMKENPALFAEAVLKFFDEHPPEQWKLAIKRAYMPGMQITITASKR